MLQIRTKGSKYKTKHKFEDVLEVLDNRGQRTFLNFTEEIEVWNHALNKYKLRYKQTLIRIDNIVEITEIAKGEVV